jgi:hypothetical protein
MPRWIKGEQNWLLNHLCLCELAEVTMVAKLDCFVGNPDSVGGVIQAALSVVNSTLT